MNENRLPERPSTECCHSVEPDGDMEFAATVNEMVAANDAEGLRRLIASLRPDTNELPPA